MRVKTDMIVTLSYRLEDSEGRLIEDRPTDKPFIYLHGYGNLIPVLEKRLEGQTAGFQLSVKLAAREAYGEYQKNLLVEVPRQQLPPELPIEAGRRFSTSGPNGEPIVVRVVEFDENMVVLDGNHPLAGVDLAFDVKVLAIRAATEQEVEMRQPSAARDTSDDFH